jgi:hypothetical protein
VLACALALVVLTQVQAPAAPSAQASGAEKPRLLVTDFSAQGVTAEEAQGFTSAVANALSQRGLFDIVSSRELETTLGAERQRQLLGVCESDPGACAHDLGQAITARFVLSGQLSKLGSAYQLSLQMVDTTKGVSVARSIRLARDIETLRSLVPYIAAEATGSPLPPPPSKVLPISLLAVGGAAVVTGAVLGMLALSRESVLNDELCPTGATALTRCSGVSLRPRDYYVQQNASIAMQKTGALALLAGGAVVAVLGVVFWPKDTGPRLALLPSFNGFAVAGLFP